MADEITRLLQTLQTARPQQAASSGSDRPATTDRPHGADDAREAKLREAAKKFEASFIAQMLNHSGLADSLTSAGSKDTEAFATFYIEQLAEKLAERGGFGLAESIYKKLATYDGHTPNSNGTQQEISDYARSIRL